MIDYRKQAMGHACSLQRENPERTHESGAPILSGYLFYGWPGTEKVEVGTQFILMMASGKPAVFELIKVDRKLDPHDMYLVEAYPVCYLEDVPTEK